MKKDVRTAGNEDTSDDEVDFMPPAKKPRPSHAKVPKKVTTRKVKRKDSAEQIVQKLNVRCIPGDVIETMKLMSGRQHVAVGVRGFGPILEMIADGLGSWSLLRWLMDKLDPADMTLRPGPGKELWITKDTVRLILGLPSAGGGKPFSDYHGEVEAADSVSGLRLASVARRQSPYNCCRTDYVPGTTIPSFLDSVQPFALPYFQLEHQ